MARRQLVGGLVALAFVAGCAAHAATAQQGNGSRRPLTVRLTFNDTTVPRGSTITGDAIVTNSTGHRLTIPDCNGTWLQVGLVDAHLPFDPVWNECLTIPGTVLPAGRTRVPISIATTYTQCAQDPASATRELPACSHTSAPMMPPLPAGTYRTKVAMLDPHGVRGSTLGSVDVTLTD